MTPPPRGPATRGTPGAGARGPWRGGTPSSAGREPANRPHPRSSYAAVLLACLCIAAIDALPHIAPRTEAVASKLDDGAHFAVAVILALALRPSLPFAAGLLTAAVAIDLDHVPAYLGWRGLTEGSGRPYSHSVAIVAAALAIALASARLRQVALGAACGFALHLWRDAATGPGIPLLWPLSTAEVRVPYVVFACLIVLLLALLAALSGRDRGQRARSPVAASDS